MSHLDADTLGARLRHRPTGALEPDDPCVLEATETKGRHVAIAHDTSVDKNHDLPMPPLRRRPWLDQTPARHPDEPGDVGGGEKFLECVPRLPTVALSHVRPELRDGLVLVRRVVEVPSVRERGAREGGKTRRFMGTEGTKCVSYRESKGTDRIE